MKSESVEARVIEARARVAALRGDERADLPSGPERTAYNKQLKTAIRSLLKWEAAFANPQYDHIVTILPKELPRPRATNAPAGGKSYRESPSPTKWPPKPRHAGPPAGRSGTPRTRPHKKLDKRVRRAASDMAKRNAAEAMKLRATPEWQAFNEKVVRENLALQAIHQAERAALLARRGLVTSR